MISGRYAEPGARRCWPRPGSCSSTRSAPRGWSRWSTGGRSGSVDGVVYVDGEPRCRPRVLRTTELLDTEPGGRRGEARPELAGSWTAHAQHARAARARAGAAAARQRRTSADHAAGRPARGRRRPSRPRPDPRRSPASCASSAPAIIAVGPAADMLTKKQVRPAVVVWAPTPQLPRTRRCSASAAEVVLAPGASASENATERLHRIGVQPKRSSPAARRRGRRPPGRLRPAPLTGGRGRADTTLTDFLEDQRPGLAGTYPTRLAARPEADRRVRGSGCSTPGAPQPSARPGPGRAGRADGAGDTAVDPPASGPRDHDLTVIGTGLVAPRDSLVTVGGPSASPRGEQRDEGREGPDAERRGPVRRRGRRTPRPAAAAGSRRGQKARRRHHARRRPEDGHGAHRPHRGGRRRDDGVLDVRPNLLDPDRKQYVDSGWPPSWSSSWVAATRNRRPISGWAR